MLSLTQRVPALTALAFGLAFGAAASAQDKAGTALAINYAIPNAVWWSIDVGIDKGFFKDEGFAPEAIPFQNSPQAVQLLISNSVQAAVVQPEAVMDANLHGAGLVAIAQTESRPDWSFVVAKSIRSWDDLKGKTIGFSSLKVNEVWLTEKLLAAHGLKRSDWTGIQVGITPLKLAAMDKGSIGGGALFEPGAERAVRSGLTALARYDQLGDYPPSVVVTTRSWAADNRNGARLVRAFTRAHQWLYDAANRAEAEGILSKYTKADPDIAHQVYEMLFITDKIYTHDGAIDTKGLKAALQLVADAGEIPAAKLPDPESLILPVELGGLRR